MKETNTIQTHFDPITRTMSSPPRSSSSSGYGTGSSRKSYSHHNNNIIIDRSSLFNDQRNPNLINKDDISNSTPQYTSRWYEDNPTPKSALQNTQYIKTHHHTTDDGTLHGIEITHSSSSPMSSISDTSSAASPAVIHQSANTPSAITSNKIESTHMTQSSNAMLTGSAKIGSGKNSAFQRVISSSRSNIDNNQRSKDVRHVVLGDANVGSSASSGANSTTSSPKITQMIYQQPPKPSTLLTNVSDKFSPPNLQSAQAMYGSSGNTDNVIYKSQQDICSIMPEQQTTSHSRRPLLEEKRSIDAKV